AAGKTAFRTRIEPRQVGDVGRSSIRGGSVTTASASVRRAGHLRGERPDGGAEGARPIEVRAVAGAPDHDPPRARRSGREGLRPGPEQQVALPVDEEGRARVSGEARPERLADERANRDGAGAVAEAVAEDRVAHRG